MPRAIYTKDHNAIVERLKKRVLNLGLGKLRLQKNLVGRSPTFQKLNPGRGVLMFCN